MNDKSAFLFSALLTCLCVFGAPQYSAARSTVPTVLVLGDSISASYGIPQASGWVELFKRKLGEKGDFRVINASVSGETTSGGLRRLPRLLKEYQPDLLIVELGANDGLRGQPVKLIKKNLQDIVRLGKNIGSEVYLLGMHIPPNYGTVYASKFHAVYSKVAEKEKVAILPFFLEGVAANRTYMQGDGLHPNEKAQPILLKNMLSELPDIRSLK